MHGTNNTAVGSGRKNPQLLADCRALLLVTGFPLPEAAVGEVAHWAPVEGEGGADEEEEKKTKTKDTKREGEEGEARAGAETGQGRTRRKREQK